MMESLGAFEVISHAGKVVPTLDDEDERVGNAVAVVFSVIALNDEEAEPQLLTLVFPSDDRGNIPDNADTVQLKLFNDKEDN